MLFTIKLSKLRSPDKYVAFDVLLLTRMLLSYVVGLNTTQLMKAH